MGIDLNIEDFEQNNIEKFKSLYNSEGQNLQEIIGPEKKDRMKVIE